MPEITRTKLPGVGVRHEFACRTGGRIGVLTHHNGDRELLFYSDDDLDTVRDSVRLGERECLVLAELLGATHVSDSLDGLEQDIEGLVLDWMPVAADAPAAGHTIGDLEIRRRTGVSVVAVLHGRETLPSPGPQHRIEPGQTLVLVGTRDSVDAAEVLLAGT